MNLHMSYDSTGFEVALENSGDQECDNYEALLDQYVVDGFHDFKTGNCKTFQIYNDAGKVIFSFPETFIELTKENSVTMTLDEALGGKLETVLGINKTGKESA